MGVAAEEGKQTKYNDVLTCTAGETEKWAMSSRVTEWCEGRTVEYDL